MLPVTSSAELAAACARLAAHPYVTVDTEFLRETTYYSKLCLIQMASPEEAILVDPLAPGLDLAPFFALMTNPAVVKVFHSARQDVEIIWFMGHVIPTPLFDTQVAAMVCGYGDSVSYEQLVSDLARARIDKTSRFTDWSRRPLTEQQVNYALGDVTHLRAVYEALRAQLAASGREDWLADEMAVLTSPATYDTNPDDAWLKLGGRLRKTRDALVLRDLAAWREREARSRDVPRSRILKDDALIDIAVNAPRTAEALGQLRSTPNGFERSRAGGEIIAVIKGALDKDPRSITLPSKERGRSSNGALMDLLKVLLKAVSENEKVAPKLIATTDDLEAIAADDNADAEALKGWRRSIFGERALALKHGRIGVVVDKGKVSFVDLPEKKAG
ncbi:ribonuclease D [Camelimonas lactis]|uniref:Ribonuclease D n=1 Tax=Camelimonas lactis TaxID=659006 RepID=A0A4R2GW84_9HYPH|nr:ribonuclease D [Camelimonas lactis]TCO15278.1 ribonuclease D [Camelimonas lactis]